ncbi:MAG: hypothetical protein KME08_12375 [Aphanothece sp. CMT-3BRIN-NPC111]|nr:hypothetical protein [Aphanothece sp. CMT-3BRIN-NPC111]
MLKKLSAPTVGVLAYKPSRFQWERSSGSSDWNQAAGRNSEPASQYQLRTSEEVEADC